MTNLTNPPGTITQLMRLAKVVLRATPESELGMSFRQFQALSLLATQEEQLQHTLCQQLLLDANNTVLLLNELEEQGWVQRQRDPTDRRRHLVTLTPAGREAYARAELARESVEDHVLAGLSADERAQLATLVQKALAADTVVAS
jgi:DNA-binding MarR family transcriptional regulator